MHTTAPCLHHSYDSHEVSPSVWRLSHQVRLDGVPQHTKQAKAARHATARASPTLQPASQSHASVGMRPYSKPTTLRVPAGGDMGGCRAHMGASSVHIHMQHAMGGTCDMALLFSLRAACLVMHVQAHAALSAFDDRKCMCTLPQQPHPPSVRCSLRHLPPWSPAGEYL